MIGTRTVREPLLRRLAMACVLDALRLGNILRLQQSEMDAWIEDQDDEPDDPEDVPLVLSEVPATGLL